MRAAEQGLARVQAEVLAFYGLQVASFTYDRLLARLYGDAAGP